MDLGQVINILWEKQKTARKRYNCNFYYCKYVPYSADN